MAAAAAAAGAAAHMQMPVDAGYTTKTNTAAAAAAAAAAQTHVCRGVQVCAGVDGVRCGCTASCYFAAPVKAAAGADISEGTPSCWQTITAVLLAEWTNKPAAPPPPRAPRFAPLSQPGS
jgi:hypothetical protein